MKIRPLTFVMKTLTNELIAVVPGEMIGKITWAMALVFSVRCWEIWSHFNFPRPMPSNIKPSAIRYWKI